MKNKNIFTKEWMDCKAVFGRSKNSAQTAIATIGTSAVMSEVNWLMVLSVSLMSGILSMFTSIAGLPRG